MAEVIIIEMKAEFPVCGSYKTRSNSFAEFNQPSFLSSGQIINCLVWNELQTFQKMKGEELDLQSANTLPLTALTDPVQHLLPQVVRPSN